MKRTILVIEDDEVISYILEFMLTKEGFEAEVIPDGLSALNRINGKAGAAPDGLPALVLLDVMLPHVDGRQLISAIRASDTWREVPVLMLTSKAQEANIAEGLAAGANDYIIKPFTPADVIARIRTHLPEDKAAS